MTPSSSLVEDLGSVGINYLDDVLYAVVFLWEEIESNTRLKETAIKLKIFDFNMAVLMNFSKIDYNLNRKL